MTGESVESSQAIEDIWTDLDRALRNVPNIGTS
jgi:hypothetical protein